ncbi:hypothetical protein [Kribbella lupini]|uniref:Lipoprotein n=1 Tax=Kribbella lupini TaxID=291602 RepID=A0ABP4M4M5_9ACTN
MRRTRTGLAAVALCATAVLTGCGPPLADHRLGMTVDDSGNPVIVLQDCKEGDVVELQLFDESRTSQSFPGGEPPVPIAVYTTSEASKTVRQIPVKTGGAGWAPTAVVPALRASASYKVRGWGKEHQSYGGQTIFTPNDLKSLKPGEVLYGVQMQVDSEVHVEKVRYPSLDEFSPSSCD